MVNPSTTVRKVGETMANELMLGTRRVGDLIDFDPDTPEVKVVLEHSDRGLGITVSWSSDDSPYASWFLRDIDVFRVPPLPEGPPVPEKVLFRDSYGFVLLIGCRAREFHSNVLGPGSGTLWARAAILGVDGNVDFDNPNGLQTDISGLRGWLGVSSWSEKRNYEEPRGVIVQSLDVPDIEIGEHRGVRFSLSQGWGIRHEDGGDRRILTDYARCVSRSDQPKAWSAHLRLHHAIRDLLVLSRWHDESCSEALALRLDHFLPAMNGATHLELWREVVVPYRERESAPKGSLPHLFKYADLGAAGLLRWISLRDEFARALDPVISSIRLRETTASTLLAHTGPGLEALGYLLLLRDGCPNRKAADASLKTRLERILADLEDCLPFDAQTWVTSTSAAYNGLKHANRLEPDPIDVLNAWRESVLVVRAWVAVELGVPQDKIKERLSTDPRRHAYVKVE